jgi:hypothetical protein
MSLLMVRPWETFGLCDTDRRHSDDDERRVERVAGVTQTEPPNQALRNRRPISPGRPRPAEVIFGI